MVKQLIAQRVSAVQQTLHPFFESVLQAPAQGGAPITANFMTGRVARGNRTPGLPQIPA